MLGVATVTMSFRVIYICSIRIILFLLVVVFDSILILRTRSTVLFFFVAVAGLTTLNPILNPKP